MDIGRKKKGVSFATDERNIKTFVQNEEGRKSHLQGIARELQKTAQRSPVDSYCIQNLGAWMSSFQIYDFEDLEMKKDSLNPTEYGVMRVCLNAKLNPKSISDDDFKFVKDFATQRHVSSKRERKERTQQANIELQKDLETLDEIIAQREREKRHQEQEQEREKYRQKRQEDDEREQYNRTVYLGLQQMDTSDDMVEFDSNDNDEDSDEDNDDAVTKRVKQGGGSGGSIIDTVLLAGLLFLLS